MTATKPVRGTVQDGIGVVVLDRAGKHNALTTDMWNQLPTLLTELVDHGAACIVITGANGSFSAGADLREVYRATQSRHEAEAFCQAVVGALTAIASCPVPTIARLSGIASGGGAEIALAADLRIADDTARFQLPLAGLGVVPDHFTYERLAKLVGSSTARYLLLTAETLDAADCLRTGIAHEVTAPEELDRRIDRLTARLRHHSAFALTGIKQMALGHELRDDLPRLSAPMIESFMAGDVARGAQAFLN
ncbi:enoyl-CoA hydratase/isomerase family protein [Aeromicrobium sp. YIM 150415]|uniref:enoyl-CoA hydratase/isomerase family protein n=1 Tax=Aeromicrobium sp. YIM 150415 TaxID=2803912 RepID=UPI0019632E02|nr:enoyl-CoA hydratase/isomerase family protein [Aeromicrobium sp. YIM 150415]MBM9461820.1 enoyl-CoA hydratase/isomerase family protein [Aeromicrobium sp. YIM 150415]MBM9463168.1 enoyl-CoA hydratase/isomerase family protein [Aeromicrobium sp. YIM 150415]